jgi:HTH-type transcriptional regulator/antitoxin HigA
MDNTSSPGVPVPGEFIRQELDKHNWTQEDLAKILDRPLAVVSRIITGKTSITPDTARELSQALGRDAQFWLNAEAAYQLSRAAKPVDSVRRRAYLYEIAPVKDMEKRGWIGKIDSDEALEAELCKFFGVESINDDLKIDVATRKSDDGEVLTPSQLVWCFRVRQIAKAKKVAEYREERLELCFRDLRKVAAYPQESHKVPTVLESYGVRFVVVEPIQSCKVDGVAMWLDDSSPVIGMSLRYDRVDSFWFTLCHELSHIRHKDEAPLDSGLADYESIATVVRNSIEKRADEEAADMLVPAQELNSFVLRIGPLYSKESIVRFAHRMKIHPGIIVGQLQHRQEMGYYANREMLAKVRQVVVPAATTDGWGNCIDPRNLS